MEKHPKGAKKRISEHEHETFLSLGALNVFFYSMKKLTLPLDHRMIRASAQQRKSWFSSGSQS